MKNLHAFILAGLFTLFASCDNNDSNEELQANDLVKIVTVTTHSDSPVNNTTNVKRYVNFEVVSDSTFDYQGNFIRRTTISMNGLNKTIKSFLNTGELMEHREENYDSQGRLIGRHTYEPISALFFTYIYNDDGTVTSQYYNDLDNQITTFRTFTKNADGLIFKNNYSIYNSLSGQTDDIEENANYQGQKLISVNYGSSTITFDYYPNPMPANLQKSVNQLNNLIIMGNDLRYLAYSGNSYYKVSDEVITNFNTDNYKTYSKSIYTNTLVTPNTTTTTERFYFYN